MFSRSAVRLLAFDVRWTPKHLACTNRIPSSIVSQRAYLHSTRARLNTTEQSELQKASRTAVPETPVGSIPRTAQFSQPEQQQHPSTTEEQPAPPQTRKDVPESKRPVPPTFTSPLKVTKKLLADLPHLATQGPLYVVAHLHDRPYLLTAGDQLRLPFLMPDVEPGNVLRFNRASAVGSRDYTLKGMPYIDERLFECRVRVLGVESDPMSIKEKTKRRQRHVQHIRSKHRHTIMRVMEVRVNTAEELLAKGAVIVEEGRGEEVEAKA